MIAMLGRPLLKVTCLRVRTVNVPIEPPIQTAAGAVRSALLVLVDMLTDEGIVGSAFVFTYTLAALGPTASLVANLAPVLRDHPLAPLELRRILARQFRLLGPQGLAGLALSVIDMAAWDAHARSLGVSLARSLGATGEERIRAYALLRGLTPSVLAAEAAEAVAAGFDTVKVKIGHAGLEQELAVIAAVRDAVGPSTGLTVDYNQALTVPEAVRRGRVLEDHGLVWIEEPVRADDYAGHAAIARALSIPLQVGENFWGPDEVARSLAAGGSDFLMPDLMKIGGVSGWMETAALAQAGGAPVSSHLFIEFSSQVMTATPGRHFLEYLDLAAPILAQGSPQLDHGFVIPHRGPGAGLEWDEEAVRRYEVG